MTKKQWKFLLQHTNDVINDGGRLMNEEVTIEIPQVYFNVIDSTDEEQAGIEIHLMNDVGRMMFRLLQDETWRVNTSTRGKNDRPPIMNKFLYMERFNRKNTL